jgi:hypothetical protein
VQPTLLTRLRWRLEELRDAQDAKVIVGVLLLAALTIGGFLAARTVARSSAVAAPSRAHVVTLRQRTRLQGRVVTHWRLRTVKGGAQAVMHTLRSPDGVRVLTRPVSRTRVVYRKQVVMVHGQARTVLQPVTSVQTLTRSSTNTQLVTVTRRVTNTVTVQHQVTAVVTTTVVSTKTVTQTVTLPITVTVTLPLP